MITLFLAYLDEQDDKDRFENIYYAYRKQMVTVAIGILQSEDDAEDAVSQVFLQVASKNWERVKQIDNPEDLRNYLLKSTKNAAFNQRKQHQKADCLSDEEWSAVIQETDELTDDSMLDELVEKASYQEAVKAIQTLNDHYKSVMYYHLVMEIPIPEVSKMVGQPVSTTRKQIARGKKLLLTRLAQ